MIDLNFSKEMALPHDLWGLIFKDWKPTTGEGVTVFLQALEKRGDNNLRKRIYFSAVTPDLYGRYIATRLFLFSTSSCLRDLRTNLLCGTTSIITSMSIGTCILA